MIGDPARHLRPLRLLQPLVALRVHAGHVGRRARRDRRLPDLEPRRLLRQPGAPVRLPRSVAIMDWLLLLAFVAGARMLARTLIERPAARGHRRPRQGGDRRRRRRRRPPDRQGDAAPARRSATRRSASSTTTRRRGTCACTASACSGTTDDLPRDPRRAPARRGADRDPVRAGQRAREGRRHGARRESIPVKTLPGLHELISGDVDLAGQIRPVQVEDVLGREPVEVDLEAIAVLPRRRDRARHRRRRLDRLRALPPDRPPRRSAADPGRERGDARCSRSSASSSPSAASRPARPCSPTSATGRKLREVFERYRPAVVFHAAAYKHVGLMEANPLESVRNNTLATRVVADVAVEFEAKRFVLVSTDKAANPKNLMGQSKALCEWIVEAYGAPRRRRHALRRRALRQRARLLRQRDPDLPPPDRARRAGHRHAPGDDAVLHDDPGGGLARRPGRLDRRPRRDLRARHGRAGPHPRPRAEHDPALRPGARPRHRDRVHRRAARREAARGALVDGRDGRATTSTRRSCARRGRRSTPAGSTRSWPSSSASSPTARRSSSCRSSARWSRSRAALTRRSRRSRHRLVTSDGGPPS